MTDRLTYLKLCAVTMIWGATFVAGRYLATGVDPLLAATQRFMLASAALLGFMGATRVRLVRPRGGQLLQLAVLGFFGIFFYNLCFFYGLHYINASRASLIVALNPAVIGLAAWLLFKERLGAGKCLGIALCLGGAGVVIISRNPQLLISTDQAWLGDVLVFGCVVGWGVYSLCSRTLNLSLGPLQTVTWSILLGTAMLASVTAVSGKLTLTAVAATVTTAPATAVTAQPPRHQVASRQSARPRMAENVLIITPLLERRVARFRVGSPAARHFPASPRARPPG